MNVFRKIIRSLYGVLNLFVILWLVMCFVASKYDSSLGASLISLFSFTCFFAVFSNIVFVILWLFTKKKIFSLFSLLALILMGSVTKTVFGIHPFSSGTPKEELQGIKVMTWNVHMFDLGEWTQQKTTFAKMLQLIDEQDPDILCMQEYFRDADNKKLPYSEIIRNLGYQYESFMINGQYNKMKMTVNAGKGDVIDVGTVIFSKYPLSNIKQFPLPDKGQGMHSVDVTLESGKKFNLSVLHLTSFGLGAGEMEYIQDVKTKGVDAEDRSQSKNLLTKLTTASSKRAAVANEVARLGQYTDLPRVICGDFNDMPASYVYETVKGDLKDAFVSKGFGVGGTFRQILPVIRIDYILYDDNFFQVESFKKMNTKLSDHTPIMTYFTLK